MPVLNESLSQLSLLLIYGAMAVYTLAFLSLLWHMAKLASARAEVALGQRFERVGLALLILATTVHLVAVVLRGIAAARVPWANMYEFSITGSALVMVIYLFALRIKAVRLIASIMAGFVLLVLGTATAVFYVEVQSLMPALQSYWLVIHVIVAILATAFFSIAALLGIVFLLKSYLSKRQESRVGKVLAAFPEEKVLERTSYRLNIIGFILWTFTLIAGAIWAERAWHRYWGWDTKEVWTFIIWVIYAGYLHANATRGWSGRRSAWLGLIGFTAVIFNFTIVNLFFKGLHVYSGL